MSEPGRILLLALTNPKGGFYAEYAAVNADNVSPIPKTLSVEQAGVMPSEGVGESSAISTVLLKYHQLNAIDQFPMSSFESGHCPACRCGQAPFQTSTSSAIGSVVPLVRVDGNAIEVCPILDRNAGQHLIRLKRECVHLNVVMLSGAADFRQDSLVGFKLNAVHEPPVPKGYADYPLRGLGGDLVGNASFAATFLAEFFRVPREAAGLTGTLLSLWVNAVHGWVIANYFYDRLNQIDFEGKRSRRASVGQVPPCKGFPWGMTPSSILLRRGCVFLEQHRLHFGTLLFVPQLQAKLLGDLVSGLSILLPNVEQLPGVRRLAVRVTLKGPSRKESSVSEVLKVAQLPERAAVFEACERPVETRAPIAAPDPGAGNPDRAALHPLAGMPEPNALKSTAAFAGCVHRYVNDYIELADRNAAFLFAAVSTTLAFLNAKGVTKLWIKSPFTWSLSEALAFLAVAGLLASATASAVVLLPRKKGSPTGLVSWGAISKCRSAAEYARLVLATEPMGLTEATLEHCFELSRVCIHKYRAMGWALWFGGAGFVGTLVYLALT